MRIIRLISLLSAFALLLSCGKAQLQSTDYEGGGIYSVLKVSSAGTKLTAPTAEDESKVNNTQFFMFDAEDSLEVFMKVDTDTVQMCSTGGWKTIYALTNCPKEYSGIKTVNELKALAVDLSVNSRNSFVMSGSLRVKLPVDGSLSIPVGRLVSRVVVHSISEDFSLEAMRGEDFFIDAIYLSNVVGESLVDSSAVTYSKWYSKGGFYEDTPANPVRMLTFDALETPHNLKNGAMTTPHAFYAMPNATEDDADSMPWTPRHTKLVIKTTYKNKTYYYPIPLPQLQANTSYEIGEIQLSRPGSLNEETRVDSYDAKFEVVPVDWNEVLLEGDGIYEI